MTDDKLRDSALEYHRLPTPGKLAIVATKPLANQRDLALAYSPGVAAACEVIVADPREAASVTARGNLVGVITNGTAVLGLGPIGPLAAKPVMEGKAVLFKTFAGIDVFDIEIDERDPARLVDIIAALEPTFGAINLEDIKAPECFEVEQRLRERMHIPVFHDDQHGTAIIVAAALLNGLRVVGKKLAKVKLVASGAGAAALACLDLLVDLGLPIANITVTDIAGVVFEGRQELMDPRKARYAKKTPARSLGEVIERADIFLGLSAPGVLKPEMVKKMAAKPLIFALANPTPEIMPEEVRAVRPDAVIATGRSDYPNQVNNVLCFPFIFRGALDVGATTINEAMKKACVEALAALARAEPSDIVALAYGGETPAFGPEYLIPRPFDPRLIVEIAPAVAKAAMESGVATRPIADFPAYRDKLSQFVFRTGLVMKPLFDRARRDPKRVVYAEGEDERVLRAVQTVIDEKLAHPILLGRRRVIESRLRQLGLRIKPEQDFELVDPQSDRRYKEYWTLYHNLMERRGRHPRRCQDGGAHPHHRHRGPDGQTGSGGCHDLRRRWTLHAPSAPCARHHRAAPRGAGALGADGAGAAQGRLLPLRYPCHRRAHGRRHRRDDPGRGRGDAPLRDRAQGRAALPFELRGQRRAIGAQDAGGARPWFWPPIRISRSRGRCRPSSRSRPSCASGSSPIPGLPDRQIFWSCPPWMPPIWPWACCASWGRGCPSGRS